MGLINDIPTVGELISRIVSEAEDIITGRLAGMVKPAPRRESARLILRRALQR